MKKNLFFILVILNIIVVGQPQLELQIQMGHYSDVLGLAFSPDGKIICSSGEDGTIKLWDVTTGKLLRTLAGHKSAVNEVVFTSDGKQVVSCSNDNTVKIWDIEKGALLRNLEPKGKSWIQSVDISPDGKHIIAGIPAFIVQWNFQTGAEERVFQGHTSDINTVKYSADGQFIYSVSGNDQTFCKWNVNNGTIVWRKELKMNRFQTIFDFTADGKNLVSNAFDYGWILWEAENGKQKKTIKNSEAGYVRKLDVSKNNLLATACGAKSVQVWDLATRKILWTTEHTDYVFSVAFSTDGKFLASAGRDMLVHLWDAQTGKLLKVFHSPAASPAACDMGSGGLQLFAGYTDPVLRVWDLKYGRISNATFFNGNSGIYDLSVDRDEKIAVTTSTDSIRIWDLQSLKQQQKIKAGCWYAPVDMFPDGKTFVYQKEANLELMPTLSGKPITFSETTTEKFRTLCLSNNTKLIATGTDHFLTLWNTETQKSMVLNNDLFVSHVAFSPDNKILASAGHTADLWDTEKGTKIMRLNDGYKTAFSPDGTMMAIAKSFEAIVYNKNGYEIATFKGHSHWLRTVLFTPDSKRLITAGDDKIMIWDIATKQLIATLVVLRNTKEYVIFTPDGYYSASREGMRAIHFSKGTDIFTFENFDLIFNRPDIVLQRLGLADQSLINSYKQAYLKRLKRMGFIESQLSTDMHLPEIEFVEKKFPIEASDKTISFRVSASDSKYTLDRLNVFVNDVPVYGMAGISLKEQNSSTLNKEVRIELSGGRNKVQVSVLNTKGAESLRKTFEITCTAQYAKPSLYVVAIGVSDYQDKNMSLRYASKDASDLVKLLSQQKSTFNEVKTLKICDKEATKENIARVSDFLKNTTVDDEVCLFVAGHGLLDEKMDWYFATYDTDFNNPSLRAVAYESLEGLLDGIPARKKLLLMDACHSGEVDADDTKILAETTANTNAGNITTRGFKSIKTGTKKSTTKTELGLKNSFELMQELFSNLQKGSGAVVISSAGGAEYALESSEWNNGVFTYSLLEGIKTGNADVNKDKTITVSELREYVIQKVHKLTQGKQTPTSRKENLEFDFRMW
jgi:WD40 repeat protein